MYLRVCVCVQNPQSALTILEQVRDNHPTSSIAQYSLAKALDRLAEFNRSNALLKRAIDAYKEYLEMDSKLTDTEFKLAAERCINRMRFIGNVSEKFCFHLDRSTTFISIINFKSNWLLLMRFSF